MERTYAEKIIAIYNENNRWSYVVADFMSCHQTALMSCL